MEHEVEITGAAYGGTFVGRIEGKVVFVPFTAPGEVASVSVVEEKKSFSTGAVVKLLKESNARVTPECAVFGVCGGCSYQHIEYTEQVRIKEAVLLDSLKRIGGIVPESVEPAVCASEPYGYRSRARIHIDGNRWGFFRLNSNTVVDISSCPLLDPLLNSVFKALKGAIAETPVPGLYEIEIGCSREEGLCIARFYLDGKSDFDFNGLLCGIEGLKGIEVLLRNGGREGRGPAKTFAAYGDTLSSQTVGGVVHLTPLGVFAQANTAENGRLIETVLRFATQGAALQSGRAPLAIDLHCGSGNLTLALASSFERVVGVESNRAAVTAARNNAEANGVAGVEFVCADAAQWLASGKLDREELQGAVVVLDPPRGGDRAAAREVAKLLPGRILYVSCSPPTLARDLQAIESKGYKCTRLVLIDLFPQTYHMESVAVMERVG